MYKIQSDLAQRRARQLWLKDLPQLSDFDNLPDDERRANLVTASKRLVEQIALRDKDHPERRALCDRLNAINMAIHKIRAARKSAPGVQQHFIDVARERLGAYVFSCILAEANRRASQDMLRSDGPQVAA